MPTPRRITRLLLGCTLALPLTTLQAQATDPNIRMLVGYAPGGAVDTVARVVADAMRDSGYQVIVENRPGAAGAIASDSLRDATADGKTLMMAPTGNLTLAPHVVPSIRYDPLGDFAGIGSVARMSFALAVHPDSPAKTLPEFLELARQNPALAAYGTPGAGTAMHFIGELLARQSDVPLTHVPYRGGSAAVTDAIGGTLPSVITTLPNLLPMHRNGRLRILAISTDEPLDALPGVATFKELGFPDLVISETFGVFAPAAAPGDTIAQLHQALDRAVDTPKVTTALQEAEYEKYSVTPAELDGQIRDGHAAWKAIVDKTGHSLER